MDSTIVLDASETSAVLRRADGALVCVASDSLAQGMRLAGRLDYWGLSYLVDVDSGVHHLVSVEAVHRQLCLANNWLRREASTLANSRLPATPSSAAACSVR